MDDRRQPGGATIVATAGGGRRAARWPRSICLLCESQCMQAEIRIWMISRLAGAAAAGRRGAAAARAHGECKTPIALLGN